MPTPRKRAPMPADEPLPVTMPAPTSAPAPAPASPPRPVQSAQAPRATDRQERAPFLDVSHLHADRPTNMVMLAPIRLWTPGRDRQDRSPSIIVAGVLDTERRVDFMFRIGSQAQVRIERQYGKDVTAWPGKIISLKPGEYEDTVYVEVLEKVAE